MTDKSRPRYRFSTIRQEFMNERGVIEDLDAFHQELSKMYRALGHATFSAHEGPIVADLRRAGLPVDSVVDLYNRKNVWDTTEAIPWSRAAVPVLAKHLLRDYPFTLKTGIARALNCRDGYPALPAVVQEFERTASAEVEKREVERVIALAMEGAGEYFSAEEINKFIPNRWEDYRFALVDFIGRRFRKKDRDLVVRLLRDEGQPMSERLFLAKDLRSRLRRWKDDYPEGRKVVEDILGSE